jgi:hypothetical protein
MWNELKTSTSDFSPYSQKNKEAAQSASTLEESLSRNIRLSLKEMRTRR